MNVLIVDDDALIRDSLSLMIDLEEDMTVSGTCADGQAAVVFCESKQVPDLILLDIRMPVMDGVRCSAELKRRWPKLKVLMLTTFQDDAYIRQAIKNGASGYLLKSQSSESIIVTIRTAYNGSLVMSEEVAGKLSDMLDSTGKSAGQVPELDPSLTRREKEVLSLVAEGKTNKEIAQILYLSEGTIRNNITRMLEKLNLGTRTQLAIYYMKRKYEKDS